MHSNVRLAAAVVSVVLLLGGCAHSSSEKAQEQAAKEREKLAAIDQLARFDQQQILLARLALENSDNLRVRQFAQQLIADHEQQLQMLRSWTEARAAEAGGISRSERGVGGGGTAGTVSGSALAELTNRIDQYEQSAREEDVTSLPALSPLEQKTGSEFDRAFLEEIRKSQHEATRFVESGAQKFKDDRVFADILTRTDPVLKQHITQAANLEKQLK